MKEWVDGRMEGCNSPELSEEVTCLVELSLAERNSGRMDGVERR